MCAIAGFIETAAGGPGTERAESLSRRARAMADRLAHRGPDEAGAWAEGEAGLAFGHRRLAIIDLTPAGRQPMVSASGRFVLCYNGEIYNAEDMRRDLEAEGHAIAWRGHSDTEALLEACAAWGVEQAISRAIGMFAFALWDRAERRLWLARDRIGIKPLYWCAQDWPGGRGLFLFASELRALEAHPGFRPEIDRDALAAFVRHNYYPDPHTVYRGTRQLPPGHLLTVAPGKAPEIRPYWRLEDALVRGRAAPFEGSEREAIDALEALLGDAVRRRMVADVPLGAFLSGGYDSSTVVALMQAASARPVRTFSIGFRESAYDEAMHARAVARHLGTDHTELHVTPREAQDVIPHLPEIYDEPFADASQVPTFLVSRLARGSVTVSLSGDGGDELFAGYNRYAQGLLFRRYTARVPRALRRVLAALIRATPPGAIDALFALLPESRRPRLASDKLRKLADILPEEGDSFFRKLTSHWPDPRALVPGALEPETVITDRGAERIAPDFIDRMQYRDILTYLPSDILTKVDRASMAVSLEARVPLLDHRVVEFAWSLPFSLKIRRGERKWLLRQVLYRHVPRALVDRPKMGFGIPIDAWLRGPLRDWAEDLLDERRLREGGLFEPTPIRKRWQEHLTGKRNWQDSLWTILMFEAWRRHKNGPHAS